jgi:N-acetylneuraminic acid mutarotase
MRTRGGVDRIDLGSALVALLVLAGCPLRDDYFVDQDYDPAGAGGTSAGAGGAGGTSAGAGGAGGTSAGASGAGNGGGVGTGGTTGSDAGSTDGGIGGTMTRDAATDGAGTPDAGSGDCSTGSCKGTCCGSLCVDLQTNPSRCGACTTSCLAGQSCIAGTCSSGWGPMLPPPPEFVARERAAYTAFDGKLFIFGGADLNDMPLGDGAIYDPATNTWKLISIDANAPSPRRFATAVWTGSRILVFGGRAQTQSAGFTSGAAYDPDADRWTPMSSGITGRVLPAATASASVAAFCGGNLAYNMPTSGGEKYDIDTNAWQPISGGPGALQEPAVAVTGQAIHVFGGMTGMGGNTKTNLSWTYALGTNQWTSWGQTTAPTARWGALATWDGVNMFAWGGRNETAALSDGKAAKNGAWTPMLQTGAPSPRWAPLRQTGWAFSRGIGDIVFLGGVDINGNALTDGGRYDSGFVTSTPPSWSPIPGWPSGEAHSYGVAVYAGGAVLVWGGSNGNGVTRTGERWAL